MIQHQWAVRKARWTYSEPQHSWARIPGSARRRKMSLTASRGFKVMLLAFVVLQSYVKASIISIVAVFGVKPN